MMSDEPFEELRRVLDTRFRSDSTTAECLDDDIIAGLADGTLDPALRASVLPHVAACARCRGALASVARTLADPAVARELAATGGGRRSYRIVVPLAAAAALLLLLWSPANDGAPGHRGPAPPATTPVPQSPIGTVAAVNEFRWRHVAAADRYRVTLFDATGRVVYAIEVADTIVAFPDSIALIPGDPYLWKADARTGFDRWVASELAEFSIAGARRR